MKLQCDVEVVNRMLPTYGIKNRGKGVRAVLSIGRLVDKTTECNNIYLMICTANDRAGSKYKLKENIETFFTRFVAEGEATVILKESALDICLSFRLTLTAWLPHSLPLSTLTPARARDVEKPKKKLTIVSKKDYPLTSTFPNSLEPLQPRELINLKLEDNKLVWLPFRIGHLSKLRFLSATHNQLAMLPGDFRKLTLENLDLFGNPFVHPNPLDHTIQLCISSLTLCYW
ncbi:unnamed protein product [Coregonus sp. 'balchen']|nr:unnamed protein product [Coregonus sp. 'balchen']